MKSPLSLLAAMCLVGCVNNPYVKITNPDGTTTELSTGRNLGADVTEQVSEVRGNGYVLKNMVKKQEAAKVWLSLIRTAGTLGVAGFSYLGALETEITNRIAAGEITKREGQRLLQEVELARVDLAKTQSTTLNPNIPLPIRQ